MYINRFHKIYNNIDYYGEISLSPGTYKYLKIMNNRLYMSMKSQPNNSKYQKISRGQYTIVIHYMDHNCYLMHFKCILIFILPV